MRFNLRHVLGFVILIGACDGEPADPPANTTTTNGSGGEAETDDPDPTEGSEGCVPPTGDGWACNSDAQCAISGDCCGCSVYNPNMGSPGNCGGSCEMNKCEEWGISEAVCRGGFCEGVGYSCNQTQVLCDAEPPACEDGFLPRVDGDCFTGDCLPIEACDWAPSCDSCGAGQLCMREQRGGCDYVRCVENIAECEGGTACCTGGNWCGNGQCVETPEGFACQ